MAGVGYSFDRDHFLGVWRYLDYDQSSSAPIQNTDFTGPALGVTFHV